MKNNAKTSTLKNTVNTFLENHKDAFDVGDNGTVYMKEEYFTNCEAIQKQKLRDQLEILNEKRYGPDLYYNYFLAAFNGTNAQKAKKGVDKTDYNAFRRNKHEGLSIWSFKYMIAGFFMYLGYNSLFNSYGNNKIVPNGKNYKDNNVKPYSKYKEIKNKFQNMVDLEHEYDDKVKDIYFSPEEHPTLSKLRDNAIIKKTDRYLEANELINAINHNENIQKEVKGIRSKVSRLLEKRVERNPDKMDYDFTIESIHSTEKQMARIISYKESPEKMRESLQKLKRVLNDAYQDIIPTNTSSLNSTYFSKAQKATLFNKFSVKDSYPHLPQSIFKKFSDLTNTQVSNYTLVGYLDNPQEIRKEMDTVQEIAKQTIDSAIHTGNKTKIALATEKAIAVERRFAEEIKRDMPEKYYRHIYHEEKNTEGNNRPILESLGEYREMMEGKGNKTMDEHIKDQQVFYGNDDKLEYQPLFYRDRPDRVAMEKIPGLKGWADDCCKKFCVLSVIFLSKSYYYPQK